MNLTWHIVRKDLRRFWIPLLLLCIVSALRFGVGINLLKTKEPDPAWFMNMAIYADILWGFGLVVTYLLVAAVVQEDSLASTAFWQTRPISGPRLLGSKALALTLMFGLLPVLLTVPWWLGCGFGWNEISRASFDTFSIQMAVVLLALPWAVVTGNYGRFLLWTCVAAVAWITAALLSLSKAQNISNSTEATRLVVIALVAATGCLAVAIHQFVTRRTWLSVTIILVTAILLVGVNRWWAWEVSGVWLPQPAPPSGLAKDIHISFDSAYAFEGSPQGNTMGYINILAQGVPPQYVLSSYYDDQTFHWADGSIDKQGRFDMWGRIPRSIGEAGDQLRMAPASRDEKWMEYTKRHRLIRISDWDPKSDGKTQENYPTVLTPETLRKLHAEKPEFDGTFWFRLFRPELVGEKDLRVGSGFAKGSSRTRVVAIQHDEARADTWLFFIESSPGYMWSHFLAKMELAPWRPEPAYGLIEPSRSFASSGFNETRDRASVADVSIVLRREGFAGKSSWNPTLHIWEKVRDSLEGATLAEVDYHEVERFSLPLKVDRFTMGGTSQPATSSGKYTVTGEVLRPGTFDLGQGETLINALRNSGGVLDQANLGAIGLTRTGPDGTSSRIVVDVEAWLDGKDSPGAIPALQPGDVIDVPLGRATVTP